MIDLDALHALAKIPRDTDAFRVALDQYIDRAFALTHPPERRPATLAVEHYGDALWLCAVRGAGSEPLAHFSSPEAAQRFRVLLSATQASARAAGVSGI